MTPGPRGLLAVAALALVATSPGVSRAELPSEDWAVDDGGRVLRVGFDPGHRLWLGAGAGAVDGSPAASLELGLAVRDVGEEGGVVWKIDHLILPAVVSVGGDGGELRATAWSGRFLRWSKDGAITLPGSPPATIPFPFDVGAEVRAGRLELEWSGGGGLEDPLEIGVVDAALIFDLWRTREPGSFAVFGFGPSYDLTLADGSADHGVAPFSRLVIGLRHQWERGRQHLHLRGSVDHSWWSRRGEWRTRARAALDWEVTLLAVNDLPVALALSGAWDWDEARPAGGEAHHLRLSAGLRLGVPL